jgi:hypothetical protein
MFINGGAMNTPKSSSTTEADRPDIVAAAATNASISASGYSLMDK